VKRLLFLTERFPPDLGGLARSAGRITQTFCQLGLTVDVVAWSRYLQPGEVSPPEANPTEVEGLSLHRIGLYRHWDMTMPHTLNVLDWLHQIHPYDAVWGHYLFPAGFLATWFATPNNLPHVVSARGNDIDRESFPPGDFARLQWTLENATLVTAVSQEMAHKIQMLSHRKDVLVLRNAVDDQVFKPLSARSLIPSSDQPKAPLIEIEDRKQALGIRPDEVVLGFSGELREKKGQLFLLQALTRVRSQRQACLLIIGDVRPSTQSILQAYAATHPEDAERIIVTGHLADLAAVVHHLHLCDLYLQPSLWDGLPNALLEAMACGCCCIASDAGGIPEVIEHGKTGFLLPRSQLHYLGEAVLECLSLDAEVRHAIATAARHQIQSDYSLVQEKNQLQGLIHQLMKL
jgi:glycosyltransferase involved in cell wall biosynthesis